MSKHHHNRNNDQNGTVETTPENAAPSIEIAVNDGSQPTVDKPTEVPASAVKQVTSVSAPAPKNLQKRKIMDNHSILGNKVIQLFDEYAQRMAKPSNDRQENMFRIRMLQNIVNTACPQGSSMDLATATDVARICYDKLNEGWGTIYDDTTIFRLGNTLKGTAYDMDKLVLFITAFTQMIDSAREKKKVLFDEVRIQKILKNPNMATAICRIRDNINKKFNFA